MSNLGSIVQGTHPVDRMAIEQESHARFSRRDWSSSDLSEALRDWSSSDLSEALQVEKGFLRRNLAPFQDPPNLTLESQFDKVLNWPNTCHPDNPLVRAIESSLIGIRSQSSAPADYSVVEGFHAWNQTNFARRQTAWLLQSLPFLIQGMNSFEPPRDTIVDIGTGDGQLVGSILRNVLKSHRNIRRLVLIDRSALALDVAAERVRELTSGFHVDIQLIEGNIETLQLHREIDLDRVLFVISSACIHHLTYNSKRGFFKEIANWPTSSIIVELEGNHERPETGSVEIFGSVLSFYGALIRDVLESDLEDMTEMRCLEFLLAESRNILFSDYAGRGDYHMKADEWHHLITESGCHISQWCSNRLARDSPRTMVFSCS